MIIDMFNTDCGKCRREVTRRTRWLACEKCSDWYHLECVGLKGVNEKIIRSKNLLFVCDECLARLKQEWETLTVRSEAEDSDNENVEDVGRKEACNPENVAGPTRDGGEQEAGEPSTSLPAGASKGEPGPGDSASALIPHDHTYGAVLDGSKEGTDGGSGGNNRQGEVDTLERKEGSRSTQHEREAGVKGRDKAGRPAQDRINGLDGSREAFLENDSSWKKACVEAPGQKVKEAVGIR